MCLLGACTRLLVVVPFLLQSQPLTDPVACHTPSPAFCLTSNLLGRVKPSSERLPSFQCRNPVSPSSRFSLLSFPSLSGQSSRTVLLPLRQEPSCDSAGRSAHPLQPANGLSSTFQAPGFLLLFVATTSSSLGPFQ